LINLTIGYYNTGGTPRRIDNSVTNLWLPDSNLYVRADGKKHPGNGNIDVLCLCDGKFYIGETKSNDEIEADQFAFYESICKSVAVDGVVFATTKPEWNRGTWQRIEQLKSWFTGEVKILTEKELYFDE
jgi:hypothetical protein